MGTSFQMFPPLLCLFLLFRLLLCFPLRKLPLPVFALEKRLYLREQDAGQSLHLVVGDAGAVVVGFLLPRHRAPPIQGLDSFVNSVTIFDDYILIAFNYKEGKTRLNFSDIESLDLKLVIVWVVLF